MRGTDGLELHGLGSDDAAPVAVLNEEGLTSQPSEVAPPIVVPPEKGFGKRERESEEEDERFAKKTTLVEKYEAEEVTPVPPSSVGMTSFGDADVLSGRGGGTNVHPGNRNFRDLINLHRRAYLKARKNDKPAISRSIVRTIRQSRGKFLKKDEKTGLWYEIGDDAAREKTSQALRQRAPEMRKLLFETERSEGLAAEEHDHRPRMIPPDPSTLGMMTIPPHNMMFGNPALFTQLSKNGILHQPGTSPIFSVMPPPHQHHTNGVTTTRFASPPGSSN